MLIWLFGIEIFQRAIHLFLENFKSFWTKFKIEHLVDDSTQQNLLLVAIAADRELKSPTYSSIS